MISKYIKISIILLLFSTALFFLTSSVVADDPNTIYVDNNADPGWYNTTHTASITEAINNASEGWIIQIMNGDYSENVYVNKSVTIIGESIDGVRIQTEYSEGSVFSIESNNVTIQQMTIHTDNGIDTYAENTILESLHIYNSYRAIDAGGVTNLLVSNCTINGSNIGIRITESGSINIINNNIHNNTQDGISISAAGNVVISGNTINDNIENGIYTSSLNPGSIFNNIIQNNGNGINASFSNGFTLFGNTISGNTQGIYFDTSTASIHTNHIINNDEGIVFDSASNNEVFNNYIDNTNDISFSGSTSNNQWNTTQTPGINIIGGPNIGGNYWADYTEIDEDGDGFGEEAYELVEMLIDYLPLGYTHYQLYVDDDADPSWYDATHVQTIQEAVDNASIGAQIYVYNGIYSSYVDIDKSVLITGESIDNVICQYGSENLFYIESEYVSISNMTITNVYGEGTGYAIYIYNSGDFSTFSNLNIINNDAGIYINGAENILITNNNIEGNSDYGITLIGAFNNTITRNYIQNNSIGIECQFANYNYIYDNYFENEENTYLIEETTFNYWNVPKTLGINILGGPYIGGNYWHNYSGPDTDSDGLGDTPYVVDYLLENSDNYPLTNYFTVYDPLPTDGSNNIEPGSLTWQVNLSYIEFLPPIYWSIECSNGQKINSTILDTTLYLDLTDLKREATYTIWVNVTDGHLSKSFVFTFTTKDKLIPKPPGNKKPIAHIQAASIAYIGESIVLDAGSSYDPDGFLTKYLWTLGDGTTAEGKTVSHKYTSAGTYTAILTVIDNKAASDITLKTITVAKANNPPELSIIKNTNPDGRSVQFTITAQDPDEETLSCTIQWDDGTTSTVFLLAHQETTVKSHTFTSYGTFDIKITARDASTSTSYSHPTSFNQVTETENQGFSTGFFYNFTTEEQLENQNANRSLLNGVLDRKYIIPIATATSILMLFLLNYAIEFSSDYVSEKTKDHFENKKTKKGKKTKTIPKKSFFSNKELLAIIVSVLIFAFVVTWSWVPDFNDFFGVFAINIVLVSFVIVFSEGLRAFLSKKENLSSEYIIWPLGTVMMVVSTFIGNTFSLAANQNYGENDDIKKCGRVSFIVSILLFALVVAGYLYNIFYPSVFVQMLIVITILNLFIDLFPLNPMDGYEIRHWNFYIWLIFYIVIFVSYIHIYLNFEI